MKTKLTIILFFLLNIGFAQDYKFGKISKEELMETSNANDPEAHATVLYKKHRVSYDFNQDDGFTQVNSYHERIKIYDKEGFEWANKRINLYDESNSSREKLTGLKAYTYNLVNNEIEKIKLKKEGVFEEKKNNYWAVNTITMPNIKEGCIIEIKYDVRSPFSQINDIVLQYDIPIKKIEVDLLIPEYFNYKKIINPKAVFYPKFEKYKKNRKEMLTSKSRSNGGWEATKTTVKTSNLEFQENGYKVHMDNVPALIKEPLVDNRDNYRSKIALEYEYYKPPNGAITSFSTNWNKVTETIFKNENFGDQLKKESYYKKDIAALIKDANEPLEKAILIFNFVKSKVKFNGFVGYNSEKGVKKAYKEGDGNVADINLMLTSMLKYAGLNANPVLISTRDNGIPITPSHTGFNYVIAAIETTDGLILLDASSKYTSANILPKEILNWQGRIVRQRGSSAWIDLSSKTFSKELNMLNININSDLSINGKAGTQKTRNLALSHRNKYNNYSNEKFIKHIEKGESGLVVSNLEVKNKTELNKPILYSYDFDLESAAEEIGDDIYFAPLFFMATEENIFKQDSRVFPIDFIHPFEDKYSVNIAIPESYIVESLPENSKISFNNGDANFSYIIKQSSKNKIQLAISFKIKKTLILPSEYGSLKEFFQIMIDKQSEKIVLKKNI